MALMMLLGNLVMWMYVPKVVLKINIKFKDIKEHIITCITIIYTSNCYSNICSIR